MHAITPVLSDILDDAVYLNTLPINGEFATQPPSKHFSFLITTLTNAITWFSDFDEMKPFDHTDRMVIHLLVELFESFPVLDPSHNQLVALKSFQIRYVTKSFGSLLPVTLDPVHYPAEWNGISAVELDLV